MKSFCVTYSEASVVAFGLGNIIVSLFAELQLRESQFSDEYERKLYGSKERKKEPLTNAD